MRKFFFSDLSCTHRHTCVYGRYAPEKQFLVKTVQEEFEKLYSLDILGFADKGTTKNKMIHEDFLQQLNKTLRGYYEMKLLWKAVMPHFDK